MYAARLADLRERFWQRRRGTIDQSYRLVIESSKASIARSRKNLKHLQPAFHYRNDQLRWLPIVALPLDRAVELSVFESNEIGLAYPYP